MPRFLHILVDPISGWDGPGNRLSLAEFMAQKEGAVNSKWMARDFRKFWKNRGQYTANLGDPLSGPNRA